MPGIFNMVFLLLCVVSLSCGAGFVWAQAKDGKEKASYSRVLDELDVDKSIAALGGDNVPSLSPEELVRDVLARAAGCSESKGDKVFVAGDGAGQQVVVDVGEGRHLVIEPYQHTSGGRVSIEGDSAAGRHK